jgi:acyl-CoA reductase-like NAD-dependent aldehyde dehydrogenase
MGGLSCLRSVGRGDFRRRRKGEAHCQAHSHGRDRRQRRLESGVDLSFGGYKQNGVGKEWGSEGFEECLEAKVIAIAEPA